MCWGLVSLDRWYDRCLDGWMVGWLNGWFGEWLVAWLCGWLDGWFIGFLDGWLSGWLKFFDGCIGLRMVGLMVGSMVGLMVRWLVCKGLMHGHNYTTLKGSKWPIILKPELQPNSYYCAPIKVVSMLTLYHLLPVLTKWNFWVCGARGRRRWQQTEQRVDDTHRWGSTLHSTFSTWSEKRPEEIEN